jgi:hypothetical protein
MISDEQFAALQAEIRSLRTLIEERVITAPSPERQSATMNAQEAAARLGVSVRSIREGKAGTKAIPRQQSRPILFLRSDVEKFIRQRAEQKAAARARPMRLLSRTKPRRKIAA